MSSKTLQSIEESELPPDLKEILPCDYKYQLEKMDILPSLFTDKDIEEQTITGKKIVFKEERHCIHSKTVKTKQGSRTSKQENSLRTPTAIYTYEDNLHLAAANEKELITLLADRATNSDYNFVYNLFKKYREINLGARLGNAILCEYNKELGQPFILAIVTNLMKRVHEKIRQAGEICYFDASSSFDPLNTSITLLYTSCVAGALPFDLFLTSDESEVTIEFAINKLKSILPSNAFFGRGVDLDPSMFMTDDSAAERNAIELCWPNSKRFLYDRSTVISDFKRILYANSENIMNVEYQKFQLQWYNKYSKLARHCSLLWERREFWAVSFRNGASTRGNHTNNYVERSFGIIKDIIFSRVKAYNPIQIYFFIIGNMERFYERKLLAIANKQLNSISKRFFCPRWESVDQNKIVSANIEHMYYVQSTSKSDIFYIVDSNIGICTCPKGNAGGPYKHQAAVAINHQSTIYLHYF
ncbi:14117_t:CDS:2 [Rhizophagus irregularis]|nr:14117_t:CDS:2 [Rhizophagus irregularis]